MKTHIKDPNLALTDIAVALIKQMVYMYNIHHDEIPNRVLTEYKVRGDSTVL